MSAGGIAVDGNTLLLCPKKLYNPPEYVMPKEPLINGDDGESNLPPVTETTLEARWARLILTLFDEAIRPRIRHQGTFKIKLGHGVVEINGVDPKSTLGGRFDVRLDIGDEPLAMVEFKREDEALVPDDDNQVLSYARLSVPMPPLCIITNSRETRILYTYSGKELSLANADEKTLQQKLELVASAAASDEVSAIRVLLGKSPNIFRAVFYTLTKSELTRLSGKITDLRKPLSFDFRLPRTASREVIELLEQGAELVAVVGKALSGKTNVAASLCDFAEEAKFAPIYFDCEARAAGFFQTLANLVAAQEKIRADPSDIRQWLLGGRTRSPEERPLIILDSWPSAPSDLWLAELGELAEHAGPKTYALVVLLDEFQEESLSLKSGRGQDTAFGSKAKIVQLPEILTDLEFENAEKLIRETKKISLIHGAERDRFYRLPYTWRLAASREDSELWAVVLSVLGTEQILAVRDFISLKPTLEDSMRRYVEAVLSPSIAESAAVREALLASRGWLRLDDAEKTIGAGRLHDLEVAGLIRLRRGPENQAMVSPQIPMLLANIAAPIVLRRFRQKLDSEDLRSAVAAFLADCVKFPFSEMVGALSVFQLDGGQVGPVLEELADLEAKSEKLRPDGRYAMLFEGEEGLPLPQEIIEEAIKEGSDVLRAYPLPQLIAAHVLLRWDFSKPDGWDAFAMFSARLASVPHSVRSVDPSLGRVSGRLVTAETFELSDGTSMVLISNGVIEPITVALLRAVFEAPDLYSEIVDHVLKKEFPANLPLLYRLWVAGVYGGGEEPPAKLQALTASLYDEIERKLPASPE